MSSLDQDQHQHGSSANPAPAPARQRHNSTPKTKALPPARQHPHNQTPIHSQRLHQHVTSALKAKHRSSASISTARKHQQRLHQLQHGISTSKTKRQQHPQNETPILEPHHGEVRAPMTCSYLGNNHKHNHNTSTNTTTSTNTQSQTQAQTQPQTQTHNHKHKTHLQHTTTITAQNPRTHKQSREPQNSRPWQHALHRGNPSSSASRTTSQMDRAAAS